MEDRKTGKKKGTSCGFARLTWLVLHLLLSFFCLPFFCHIFSSNAFALEPSDVTFSHAEIGFGGKYRSGFWTPISFTLLVGRNAHGDLQVVSQDGESIPVAFFSTDVSRCRN